MVMATLAKTNATLVTSRLDYANSLRVHLVKRLAVFNDSKTELQKLIFMAKKSDHVSPLLEQLHWLPVHKRIDLKIVTIIFKCYSDCAPS